MTSGLTPSARLSAAIGDTSARALERAFGMRTVDDLLRHYPRRYLEVGALTPLGDLVEGMHVTVMARVKSAQNFRFGPGGRRTRSEVVVTDDTGELSLTFFNQAWRGTMQPGQVGLFAGVVGSFRNRLQLTQPDYDAVGDRLARGVVPIYPATAKVSSWAIERAVGTCLDVVVDLPETLPESVRTEHGFVPVAEAFEAVHRPHDVAAAYRAQARFRFEEAFVIQTVLAQRRRAAAEASATARPPRTGGLLDRFDARLPFALTAGQLEVAAQIEADLAAPHPMHRLLQGEVGSGKTVVALRAMLQVVDAGGQAVLLAPTEVLAAQHHRSISSMLGDLAASGLLGGAEGATRVRLLTGSMGAKARQASLLDAVSGEAGIVVGTHALLSDGVDFADLGLVVVDEQHRFGVEQRAALVDRAATRPHVLVMTATPIPRTVAMTVFGDLETSVLRELPAGRQPIQTTVVPVADRPAWLDRVWQRVREEVGRGRQGYVVVSRIGESEATTTTRSLTDLFAELEVGPLLGLRLGFLHGRLPADEKDAVMRAFAAGDVDVLVATTVIEVGVDVPNATVMVVMDADRFGMSQLHQLRGRVGRGQEPGLCLLVTTTDAASSAAERLVAVASTTDGFELSRLDVELRSEGDVLGTRQSGFRSSLRLLSVVRHESVITEARTAAEAVVAADPSLASSPALAAAVEALEASERAEYLERT
ncbi:ATP-dependent DNA helicase RecG [Aeromicrobium marinum DSM 15272]|uniref:Probable DNA 3'-5' helicase RecG n=1 Tax=Aeromicrobium marinum DSM 15272 TaxID=585531 RepID=E2SAZ2_9ACTN|nr:ATP-dependent DNA helicase RecG [Aeromicrobium marinum]EFQ83538.1 ATP-dependent DNA helicase RecG [Aeromicrobium marinum DSM 15272]